jgi:predicted alpha/beta superfamily hydrolase
MVNPAVRIGSLEHQADFPSRRIPPRHVDVWLPPGYAQGSARLPVIYMHDGQNLFNPSLSYTGVDWGVADAVARWMEQCGAPGAIVVGVWNTPNRMREYMPQKPWEASKAMKLKAKFTGAFGGGPSSDSYLSFLVDELKPWIDARYRTLTGPQHTSLMGSSMGGLISLYGLTEYPQVFGGAGCLSTHWPIGGRGLIKAMSARLPKAGAHRIYFDYGTAGLDAKYEPFQLFMDQFMVKAGYQAGVDWTTRRAEGAEHNEAAWRARIDWPVQFLLAGSS